MTLPTPQEFLDSLFSELTTSISSSPTHLIDELAHSNTFKSLPPSHRALLISLHVFFPPPMLLQALDILDHGRVTKIILGNQGSGPPEMNCTVHETSANTATVETSAHNVQKESLGTTEKIPEYIIYLVHSHVTRTSHFSSRYASVCPPNPTYRVHLSSWNCSCAAFAFSAYPASPPKILSWTNATEDTRKMRDRDCLDHEEASTTFGGSLHYYCDGDNIPICKHLLACFLGDRWESVLGSYVKYMWVEKEEMAGFSSEH